MERSYDYIIVGGGSAGCVIATRLIEQTTARVLLLEAGPRDKDPYIHMPAGLNEAIARHTVNYASPANPATGLPAVALPQARVLGGGGSVNAMLYVRGTAQDYDDWERVYGCTGWSHRDVLPYFLRAERNESLSAPHHGTEGHLWVSEHRYRHPLSMAFVRAGQEIGYPYLSDICGAEERECVGFWQCTIHDGQRGSAARAYLQKVIDNERLTLVTEASAEKILIENGKAVGVRYAVKGRSAQLAYAGKEVIVTAGALASPKLLMLSGIGPADELRALGIEVVADSAQVGKNLQDHLVISLTAETPDVPSMLQEAHGLKKFAAGAEWLGFHHDGVVGSNVMEAGGFLDVDQDGRIDTQLFVMPAFNPAMFVMPAEDGAAQKTKQTRASKIVDGITIEVGHVHPESRGEVRLTSADPAAMPYVQANYLSAPGDLEGHLRGMRLALKFFDAPSLKRIARNVAPAGSSDEELADFFRKHCGTQFHPTSTCRLGARPEESVVDLELRVWGVENLRVADASVMPHVTSGNTNAPTIMIAERAAEWIISSASASAGVDTGSANRRAA